jgi:hypothetical protein
MHIMKTKQNKSKNNKTKRNRKITNNIIGYIHVCQKGNWHKSYDMLMHSVKKYGLYDRLKELRIGIVNDEGIMIEDKRFEDPKIKIIFIGKSKHYERPTLLHMKQYSYIDSPDTLYFYLHTKGIRHFGTKNEATVVKWIKDMLYWNIQLWKKAVDILQKYDTYGCNTSKRNNHYSGNFWWTTAKHVQTLPNKITEDYTAPEDWITVNTHFSNYNKAYSDNHVMGYCVNNCEPDFKEPGDEEYGKTFSTPEFTKHHYLTKY